MTGLEWENFSKLDREEYIVAKNKEFVAYYQEKLMNGYPQILDIDNIQKLINKITEFFEFKYPEEMLNSITYQSEEEKEVFHQCMKLSRQLDINQLKYRLTFKQSRFLECSYAQNISLTRPKEKLYDIGWCSIRVDAEGNIEPYDLDELKSEGFLKNVEGISKVDDLLGRFIGTETNVDYSELLKAVENHKTSIALRNKVLELTMLNLLYSKTTHPRNGYVRAKRFMRMFNKEYDLDLNMEKLDDIMSIDYSDNEKVKQKLKERKNN